MAQKVKNVTNLIMDIGRILDLLERNNVEELYKNLQLLIKTEDSVRRQIQKYTLNNTHELDFTIDDLIELSDKSYSVVQNRQQKFLFSHYYKDIRKNEPISMDYYTNLCDKTSKEMRIDQVLRAFYKSMSFQAVTYLLWSNTEHRKAFDRQITEVIKQATNKTGEFKE